MQNNTTNNQTKTCPICQNRGVFITTDKQTKKCTCKIELELKTLLKPLLNYPTNKTINFQQLNKTLLIKDGTDIGFYSLVKSFIFQYYFKIDQSIKMVYNLETGSSIVEQYLSPDTHQPLYQIPLLFIDLTKFYPNKAMGDLTLYILQQRQSKNLLTWLYIGDLSTTKLTDSYNVSLCEALYSIQSVSISNYTEKL